MSKRHLCDKCGISFTEHEITNINGHLIWVCPKLKGTP